MQPTFQVEKWQEGLRSVLSGGVKRMTLTQETGVVLRGNHTDIDFQDKGGL